MISLAWLSKFQTNLVFLKIVPVNQSMNTDKQNLCQY